MAETEIATIECADLTQRELRSLIGAIEPGVHTALTGFQSDWNGVAAGVSLEGTLVAQNSVGDFAATLGDIENFEIAGDAGDSLCHSFRGGRTLVRGRAGNYVAAYANGGFVIVHATAGFRCGFRLSGADVFVRGTVGDEAGAQMSDGVLVLGNGAGKETGRGMTGGTIYARGEVESFASHVKPIRMKDADSMRLSLLLARAGVKGGVIKEFKAYRPR